jgi:hypothetical protein
MDMDDAPGGTLPSEHHRLDRDPIDFPIVVHALRPASVRTQAVSPKAWPVRRTIRLGTAFANAASAAA